MVSRGMDDYNFNIGKRLILRSLIPLASVQDTLLLIRWAIRASSWIPVS